jgi:hypothetical protein
MAYAKGDKTKTLSTKEKADIVAEVRDRIEESWTHDRDNRYDAASDLAFLAGDQWPESVKREREAASRPMLTINRLPQFVRQVTNDIRQAEFSIKVAPEDDGSDPALAKIYDGLIRQIQYQSSARHVYATAAEHQASCGIGWFRICTEYPDDSAFHQEIRIKQIRNPLSVYDDPSAVEPDRSDAMWRAVTEVWPKKAFEQKYPKAKTVDVERPLDGNEMSLFWSSDDTVRIAEYWRRVPYKKTIALLEDGQTVDITGKGEGELGYLPIARTREVDSYKVESMIVSGAEVLEGPFSWAGSLIPVIPVIGGEFPLDRRTYRYGVVRFARDPQQLYNFYRTATAEAIALAPKAPYLVTPKMVGPFKALWDNAHKSNTPYLPYMPDPDAPGNSPRREAPPALPTALMQEAQIAGDDMKAVTGIYDAALGRQSNETSGVAIGRRQMESDVANYHFADNLQRSLEYAGRVLIDLIPKIYDNERIIRLMGETDDAKEEFVPINKVMMGLDGVPIMINDLSAARFDIRVKVGKSYTTKRAEAADSMLQFVQAVPNSGALAADLIAKNFDWPGADELAKRLRNTIPPEILADPDDPESQPPPPDPIMQQMAALEAAQKQADVAKTNAETENKRADTLVKLAQAMLPPQAMAEQFPVPFADGQMQPPPGAELPPPDGGEPMPMDMDPQAMDALMQQGFPPPGPDVPA